MAVDGNAATAHRTVTVGTRKGQSNAFPFTIRRGDPRITAISPSTVWPGRMYFPQDFKITGEDLITATGVELTL